MPTVTMRKGSLQGSDHIRLGYNNQDAVLAETFSVPAFGKTYWVGLVSDGSTGNPLFSHTEVGANLTVLFAYRRIQELVCSGVALDSIPTSLYPSITEFLLEVMGRVMPETIAWPYPTNMPDRGRWSSQKRFRNDYLAATLLGFISDDTQMVIFSAGDGVILVDDELTIIDQDDRPAYPVVAINTAGVGFVVNVFDVESVSRIAIASDGLKHLMQDHEFVSQMFVRPPEYFGLQFLLNTTKRPDLMKDDCTVVTWEIVKGDE